MGINYNTVSKRKSGSNELLNTVEGYDSDYNNLISQGEMLLASLSSPGNNDEANKITAVDCAMQFVGSKNELNKINSGYDFKQVEAIRWLTVGYVYALDYVPPIVTKVKDSQGTEYPTSYRDISYCYSGFKTFNNTTRNQYMRYTTIWDDDFLMVRTIRTTKKYYDAVVKDVNVNTSTSWTGSVSGVSARKTYQSVMTDLIETERETSAKPMLPSASEFSNLLINNGSTNNSCIMYYLNTIQYLLGARENTNGSRENYYDDLKFAFADPYTHEYILHDGTYSYDYCKHIEDTLPDYLYYKTNSGKYLFGRVTYKKIVTNDLIIKSEYSEKYNNSTENVKNNVYDWDELSKYYKNMKYSIEIGLDIIKYNCNNGDELTPENSIDDDAFVECMKNMSAGLIVNFNEAYSIYKNNPESTRAEDGEPGSMYPSMINYLKSISILNLQTAMMYGTYCIQIVMPWMQKRIAALINSTTDIKTAQKLVNALESRLTKGSGSLMLWYASVLSVDVMYDQLKLKEQNAKLSAGDLLVRRAYNGADTKLFNFQQNPNYIDLQKQHKFITGSFNKGDTIYIIDDYHPEHENVIENVSTITVVDADYTNADLSEVNSTGKISGVVNKKSTITRLTLRNPLPNWCCLGFYDPDNNDVSTMRVVKLL